VERWRHKFGGSGDDYGWSTAPAVGGGYFISGYSNSGADGTKKTPNFGSWDYAVVKVDDQGRELWQRSYGGAGHDQGYGVLGTADGGCIISGHSYSAAGTGNKTSPNYGDCDIWVIRLNARGEEVWQKTYGGTGPDTGWHGDVVQPTLDGGFLILGNSHSSGGTGNKKAVGVAGISG
jgi:hypothetical protein